MPPGEPANITAVTATSPSCVIGDAAEGLAAFSPFGERALVKDCRSQGYRWTMKCVYCADSRDNQNLSLEHIWPKALGGAQGGELFRTDRVCKTCNNLAGIWVDGAFLKGWFTNVEIATSREFIDPKVPGPLPLVYMGLDEEFPVEPGYICEYWAGPAGEHIYHTHTEDDDRWFGFGGGDFIKRKKNAGRVYLYLTSDVPYWVVTALKSFLAHFDGLKTRNFCLTKIEGSLSTKLLDQFIDTGVATNIEAREINWVRTRSPTGRKPNKLQIYLRFSDRFLAKIALGVGANILGDAFAQSDYAGELRKLLWPSRQVEEDNPVVYGTNYWKVNGLSKVRDFIGLKGAWNILLKSSASEFTIGVGTPSGKWMTTVVSNDSSLLTDEIHNRYDDGVIHFVIPQRGIFTNGILLPTVLLHTMKIEHCAELDALEALRCPVDQIPKPR